MFNSLMSLSLTPAETICYGLVIVLLASFLRWLPMKLWHFDPSDAWSHIYDADLISKHGGIPRDTVGYFPKSQFTYPWLFSWLIAKVKPASPMSMGSYINIAVSISEMIASALLAGFLVSMELGPEAGRTASLFVLFLLIFNPAAFGQWMSLYGIHARTLGSFFSTVWWIAVYLGMEWNSFWFLLAFVATGIILFSSKFGMQSCLLAAIALSMLLVSPVPLLVLIVSLVILNVCTKGAAYRILRGHYYHLLFYKRILQYRHRATADNTWSVSKWLQNAWVQKKLKMIVSSAIWVPSFRVFIFCPWLIALIVPLYKFDQLFDFEIIFLCMTLITLAVIPFVTTSGLRFLGEADRYYSFIGTIPITLLLSSILTRLEGGFLIILLLAGMNFVVMIVFFRMRLDSPVSKGQSSEKEIGRELNRLMESNPARVLVVPQNLNEKFRMFTSGEFVGLHTNVTWNTEDWIYYDKLFPVRYPYPTGDLGFLKGDLGVGYLITSKRYTTADYLKKHSLDAKEVELPEGRKIFENDDYILARIP